VNAGFKKTASRAQPEMRRSRVYSLICQGFCGRQIRNSNNAGFRPAAEFWLAKPVGSLVAHCAAGGRAPQGGGLSTPYAPGARPGGF